MNWKVQCLTFLAIVMLASCAKKDATNNYIPPATASNVTVADLGELRYENLSNVQLRKVTLTDGTQCVVANRDGAVSVSCNFPKHQEAPQQ